MRHAYRVFPCSIYIYRKEKYQITCLYPLISICMALFAPVFRIRILWIRRSVTGKFWTSCLHTSHVLLPLMLNHFIAHSSWAKARSPLQLHSIFRVSPPSPNSTKQILQTASSSGISSPSASLFSEHDLYIRIAGHNITWTYVYWHCT